MFISKLAKPVCAALCVSLLTASCTQKKEEEIPANYSVTSPLVLDTATTKEYVAQIQSLQNVEIHAQVKGYLEKILVDEGQHVQAGQVLFNIMPKEYEAEMQKAKAEVTTLELELQNVKTLVDKNIVSKTELAIAQSKLDEANAELSLAQLHFSFTEIKAPFEGTIDRIRFKTGSLIDEGTLLTSISNNKEVYAYFNVSENEYLDYKARAGNENSNTVTLLLANNQEHKHTGVIETIESEFDNNTGNISFRAKFPNPELLLKHGETGKVRMRIPITNAMIIPQKATFEIQDKIYVYVVDENNVVKARNISVKQKLSNLYVVGTGLSPKDKFLLDGVQSVKENDKILVNFLPPAGVVSHLQLIKQ